MGEGARWRDKLEERLSPGPVELMKDAKAGGNLTVDIWQREEKKKLFDCVCIKENSKFLVKGYQEKRYKEIRLVNKYHKAYEYVGECPCS